jgi:hypothetical protein
MAMTGLKPQSVKKKNWFPKAVETMTLTKYKVLSIYKSLWGVHPENRRPAQLPSPTL